MPCISVAQPETPLTAIEYRVEKEGEWQGEV